MPTHTLSLYDFQQKAQRHIAEEFFSKDGAWRQLGVLPTGCHAAGQFLLMADGHFGLVEHIKVGDKLMGIDGPREVLSLNRGHGPLYRITPTKGRPWVVDENHMLTLVSTKAGLAHCERGGVVVDVTVKDYLNWSRTQKHIHKLFRVPVETFADLDPSLITIDPYALGLFLGDGSIQNKSSIAVHNKDLEVLTECYREARRRRDIGVRIDTTRCPSFFFTSYDNHDWHNQSSLVRNLDVLGLLGTTCDDKFVPHPYKTGPVGVRLELVAGLLDTDGSATSGGFDFISKSQALSDDVAFVCRSLGLAAYVRPCIKTCQTGVSGNYFRVSISGDCAIIPTRIPRKQIGPRLQKKDVQRTGLTIAPAGSGDYFGFTVDGDHRYLLDDFTVTHNCGKTVVFSTLCINNDFKRFLESFPRDQRKILVIAHRTELLAQAKEKFERYNPHLNVQIEQAEIAADDRADVIVASIQTLSSRSGRRLARIDKQQVRLVICDEAHHAAAATYQAVFQYFGFLPPPTLMPRTQRMGIPEATAFQRARLEAWDTTGKPSRLLLGVTATPNRGDRVGLEAVFQKIVFEESLPDMIKRGYLCRLRALKIDSPVNLDRVHTKEGDFDEAELYAAINTVERNRVIVKAWLEHAEGLKTVVFAGNVKYAQALAEEFNANGRKFAAIHANSTDRKELLSGLASGEIEGLVNVAVLTEGWDLPTLECVVIARPTKSAALYTQMVGRGTRLAAGKTHCLIMDIVDVTSKHSLMTAPTLFGLPTDYDATGKDLSEEADAVAKLKEENPLLDTSAARSLEELEAQATEVNLFGAFNMEEIIDNSTMAWMKVNDEYRLTYIGPGAMTETLKLHPNDFGGWDVLAQESSKHYAVMPPAPTLEAAFKAGEEFMNTNRQAAASRSLRTSPWRTRPITPPQAKRISKCEDHLNLPPLDTSNLTMGQASDLIAFYHQKLNVPLG